MKMGFEPTDGFGQAVFKGSLGGEADGFAGTRNIETAPGLAVRLGWVPDYFALESAEAGDKLGQILDRNFPAAAEIHWLGGIIFLQGQYESFGAVLDIEKLAADSAGAPGGNMLRAGQTGFNAFADKRGNHVAR